MIDLDIAIAAARRHQLSSLDAVVIAELSDDADAAERLALKLAALATTPTPAPQRVG